MHRLINWATATARFSDCVGAMPRFILMRFAFPVGDRRTATSEPIRVDECQAMCLTFLASLATRNSVGPGTRRN
jgi:hypothetical protein